jgi:hypothetical protein
MNLNEIAKAINKPSTSKTILIYGKSKTGKSTMAATIAKCKSINTVHWFDNENGLEGLVTMVKTGKLTEEEAQKIIIYKIEDSVEHPYAFETISKLIGLKRPLAICDAHGRVDCSDCKKTNASSQLFDMSKCNSNTAIVIDSGSQYSDSIMHFYNDGKLSKGTAGLDAYREQGLRLVEFLTEVQGAKTNWIIITHDLVVELEAGSERVAAMDYKGQKIENTYPLIGTKPFAMKVGKYFAHVAYLEVKLGKHIGGSSTTYKAGTITGSRTGWRLEDQVTQDKKAWLSLVPLFDGS